MVDVSQEIALILQAIYGKQVRGSLGNGIKKIADEVNKFEDDTTKQQNQFEQDITKQQNDYETNVTGQWSGYKEIMDTDETARKNNENTRIGNESTRQNNEGLRQDMYVDFRSYTNELATVGKISYEIDGGWIGDEDDGTGLNIDGGTL
mgnify:CR=1 FL=1